MSTSSRIAERSSGRAGTDRRVALALLLVRHGAELVVVGGTARWLRGGPQAPRDLDLAVAEADLPALVDALAHLGVEVSAERLRRSGVVALRTAWGPVDVFVGAVPPAVPLTVDGCTLAVARD